MLLIDNILSITDSLVQLLIAYLRENNCRNRPILC